MIPSNTISMNDPTKAVSGTPAVHPGDLELIADLLEVCKLAFTYLSRDPVDRAVPISPEQLRDLMVGAIAKAEGRPTAAEAAVVTTFTPGPWRYAGDFKEIQAGPWSDYKILAEVSPTNRPGDFIDDEETAANGRLIAEAPALYDTLCMLLEAQGFALTYTPIGVRVPGWVRIAQAALAVARRSTAVSRTEAVS